MPAPILLGIAVAGAGASLLANEKGAKAANSAAKEQAKLYEKQAERIRERAGFAIRQAKFQGQKLEGRQVVAYASSGVDVSSGSTLSVMEDTARQLNAQVTSIQREANFQAEMAQTGAINIRKAADDQRKASRIANYASFAKSIGRIGTDYMEWDAANRGAEASEGILAYQKGKKAGLEETRESLIKQGASPELINSTDSFFQKFEAAKKTNPNLTLPQFIKTQKRIPR